MKNLLLKLIKITTKRKKLMSWNFLELNCEIDARNRIDHAYIDFLFSWCTKTFIFPVFFLLNLLSEDWDFSKKSHELILIETKRMFNRTSQPTPNWRLAINYQAHLKNSSDAFTVLNLEKIAAKLAKESWENFKLNIIIVIQSLNQQIKKIIRNYVT